MEITNTAEDKLLALLGLCSYEISRFRGCWQEGDRIYIMTRTGGMNREYFSNEPLTKNPYYIDDHDCDDDNTYAVFEFIDPSLQ